MNKNKLTPLEVVERYHKKYLEYENAFNTNPFDEKSVQEELKKLVSEDSDPDSDEFMEKMIDIVIDKPQKRADVNTSALKFLMYADFYYMISEESLPENLQKDYDSLSVMRDNLKLFYSIENNEFVKNEEREIDDNMRAYLKAVFTQVKSQIA